jgi:two-component system response regulator HydG
MTTSNKGRILVADYQPDSSMGISAILSRDGYDIIPSGTVEHAGKVVDSNDIDAVIMDLGLSDSDGIRLFEYITAARPSIPVIVLTAYETVEVAVAAMTRGAFYYFVKPLDYPQLNSILARAVEQRKLKREIELLKDRLSETTTGYRIIGDTPEMRKTRQIIEAVKESTSSVLISGETGTGKELIARTLHCRSTRSSASFIAVDCAAIPAEFMDAEFFGYRRGPSTVGAVRRRGKFEEAGNGVVFLDEIGRLGPCTQAKLLQFLRDGHMARTGDNEKIEVRFRLISTTVEDLREGARRDSFSEDLYRRINEIEIHVPPLRERKDDIPLLTSAFLNEMCARQKRKIMLSSEVMRAFHDHDWPGNVRQLRNVVERAVVIARGNRITLRELPGEFLVSKKRAPNRPPVMTLKQLEMQAIRETLRKCNGNKSRTARMLGISRKAFYKRLREADQFLNS